MLDIDFIRKNPELVQKAADDKQKKDVDVKALLKVDAERKSLQQLFDGLKAQQNQISKTIQTTDSSNKASVIAQATELKKEVKIAEEALKTKQEEFKTLMYKLPNVPAANTPIGKDESENIVISTWGDRPEFNFKPKEHWEIGEELGILDSKRAARVSGSRFTYVKGGAAMLQFAIIQFIMQSLTSEKVVEKIISDFSLVGVASGAFVPVIPPMLVRRETMERMGRLKPEDDRYKTVLDDLFLVGSAEHSTGSMFMDETFDEKDLPIRYVAYSSSFRREAGTYGKDTKGLIRQHQFDKLEMEVFSNAETGEKEQELLVAVQEYILRSFKIPYQKIAICTGDMGAPDYRQIDLEAWMPGQNKYRETHTSDYMTDFQSRRLNTRYKDSKGGLQYVHMNDATACALGRMIVAIIENYQQKDGSVIVPKVLQSFMGIDVITKK